VQASINNVSASNVFVAGNDKAYGNWRDQKLDQYPASYKDLLVSIRDSSDLSQDEISALLAGMRRANMVFYQLEADAGERKTDLLARNRQLGLVHIDGNLCSDEDNVTSLRVNEAGRHQYYIPYTNRRLVWHTDGYYNLPAHQIRGFALHCVRQAAVGGESMLLDHELAYIHLRDQDPAFVEAFMAPDAMTIPPNVENGVELRGARTGPVFSLLPGGSLHMRFSARTRNIEWKQGSKTQEALACLNEFLDNGDTPVYHYRLMSGQGVICNNVLHARKGFEDGAGEEFTRLLYRARYYDRVENT
jgi:alpha-ketoglutarate-dependent taurine dioxygenase